MFSLSTVSSLVGPVVHSPPLAEWYTVRRWPSGTQSAVGPVVHSPPLAQWYTVRRWPSGTQSAVGPVVHNPPRQRQTWVRSRLCQWDFLPVVSHHGNDDDSYSKAQLEISTISSLLREPSPTCSLKWPGRNRVHITSAYHVQHIVLRATWYEGTAQL